MSSIKPLRKAVLQRFDGGDKAGYIQANLALALACADIGPSVRAFAKQLLGQSF